MAHPTLTTSVAKSTVNYCATSWLGSPITAPVSACHHGSYAETYSRFIVANEVLDSTNVLGQLRREGACLTHETRHPLPQCGVVPLVCWQMTRCPSTALCIPSVEKGHRSVLLSTAIASVGSVRRLSRASPRDEPCRRRGGSVAWPSRQPSFVRSEPPSASNRSTSTSHAAARCWCAPWRPACATATCISSKATRACLRQPDGAGPRGRRHRRGGRRGRDDRAAGRPRGRLPVGLLRQCEQCLSGHPNLCPAGLVARDRSASRACRRTAALRAALQRRQLRRAACCCTRTRSCRSTRPPLDRAALVGCGVLTGVGAAMRSAGLEPGQTVAVFGCGGVGPVRHPGRAHRRRARSSPSTSSRRRKRWRGASARPTSSTPTQDDPVQAVRGADRRRASTTPSRPSATPRWCRQAVESLAVRGTATVVGVPPPGRDVRVTVDGVAAGVQAAVVTHGQQPVPHRHPALPRVLPPGTPPAGRNGLRRGRLGDVNEAFRAMKAGEVARTVLTFD